MNEDEIIQSNHISPTDDQNSQNGGIKVSSSSMDTTRCLGCGTIGNGLSVYTRLQGVHRQKSVLHKLSSLLNQDLINLQAYSDIVCQNCLDRLEQIEKLEYKLINLCQETIHDFQKTVKLFSKSHSVTVLDAENDQCLLVLKDIKFQSTAGKDYVDHMLSDAKLKKKMKKKNTKNILKNHKCSVCCAEFRSYSHKVEHMVTHLNEKPFPCNICNYAAKSKSNLNKHKLKHNTKKLVCSVCLRQFDNKIDLREHKEEHKNENPIICNECNKSFLKRKEYLVHIKLHDTQSKKYHCDECDKYFILNSRLKRHKLIHAKDKSFECTTCSKRFSRMDDLQNHQRTHTGERPYKCVQCEKDFRFMSNYSAHKKICRKKGKINHDCTPCNVSLLDENKLNNHLKSKSHENRLLSNLQDKYNKALLMNGGNLPLNSSEDFNQIIITNIPETLCIQDDNVQNYVKIDSSLSIQPNNDEVMISNNNSNAKSDIMKPSDRLVVQENDINVITNMEGNQRDNYITMFNRNTFNINSINDLSKPDTSIRDVIDSQNNSSFILNTFSDNIPSESNNNI